MLDDAFRDQLCGGVLDGVDRDREGTAVGCLSPGAQADRLAARIQERPARVAAGERGIRPDHAVDRADDALRDRTALAEGISDRDDWVAHFDDVGVAEGNGRERARTRPDLKDGEIVDGIEADDARGQALVAREAHLDMADALDDAEGRDDVAGLVDHEAGAERLPPSPSPARPPVPRDVHRRAWSGLATVERTAPGQAAEPGRRPPGRSSSLLRARRAAATIPTRVTARARRACADEGRALKCQPPHLRNAAPTRRCA